MRFLRGIQINIFELGTISGHVNFVPSTPPAQSRSEVVANVLFVVGVGSGDAGQFNVISVNSGLGPSRALYILMSAAYLHGADRDRQSPPDPYNGTRPGSAEFRRDSFVSRCLA